MLTPFRPVRIGGSAEEIAEEYEKAADTYKRAKQDMKQMERLLQVIVQCFISSSNTHIDIGHADELYR